MQLNGFPIERKKLSELTKAPYNPRKITPEQAKALQRSLTEFGTVEPIIWNKQTGHIVGGHQRLDALQSLGETETDVLIVDMPEEREQALNIALNKISGDWDNGMLSDVLLSLHEELRELTGFSEDEIAALLPKQDGLTDPDAVPEVVEPVAKLGDIWQLGEHRLMCGDSTDAGSVALLMNGDIAELCFTSPPYADMRTYSGNDVSEDTISLFIPASSSMVNYYAVNLGIKRNDGEVIEYWNAYIESARSCGMKLLSWNVWDKDICGSVANQNAMFGINHEFIFVFGAKPKILYRTVENKDAGEICDHGTKRQKDGSVKKMKNTTISSHSQIRTIHRCLPQLARDNIDHPARFTVEFPCDYIKAFCSTADSVYEPFCGSGSTLIACEQLNRKCYGMELDPHYCDVIIKRWEDFTGKKAVKVA